MEGPFFEYPIEIQPQISCHSYPVSLIDILEHAQNSITFLCNANLRQFDFQSWLCKGFWVEFFCL